MTTLRQRRRSSSATPLALAFGALVVYASLYPFSGWHWPAGQTAQRLLVLPWPPWVVGFDVWANVAGYLPLGMLLLLAARRSGVGRWPSMLLALAAPALLSYAAEVTQNFLPGRHPSLKDFACNCAGAAAGAALGVAVQRSRLVGSWQGMRERWFVGRSNGALALLALWPVGLLFPAPVPLGLGQVGDRMRELALDWLEDVPWAQGLYALLADAPPPSEPLWPLAEGLVSALGLLAPVLVAYVVVAPGWRRVVLAFGALLLAGASMTLSTALNFGPQHALAWVMPATMPALGSATVAAAVLSFAPRRLAAGIGLVVLTGLVAGVARAPADPYFAQSLQAWEQGRFVHFHGLAQWVGWLWPYAALAWLLWRLTSYNRDG